MCQCWHIHDRVSSAEKIILKYTYGSIDVLNQRKNSTP
jgi:hypothetical protein